MDTTRRSLTLIGTGRLAIGLGRLWSESGQLRIADVLGRSQASAENAVLAIGAGRAIDRYDQLEPSDIVLIATPDGTIATVADALAQSGRIAGAEIVFHCSGALSSIALRALHPTGAALGSAHPLTSFGQNPPSRLQFQGVACAIEGDVRAQRVLRDLFLMIGAEPFDIAVEHKILYHAAAVFGSNYLVTLLGAAFQTCALAGIEANQAARLLRPLVDQSVDNVFRTSPRAALTGPIARGDAALVRSQFAALAARNEDLAALYRSLCRPTAALAGRDDPLASAVTPGGTD